MKRRNDSALEQRMSSFCLTPCTVRGCKCRSTGRIKEGFHSRITPQEGGRAGIPAMLSTGRNI